MKLVPIPNECARQLEGKGEAGPGYQFVSIKLRDGRYFEPAVASEGCIIVVKDYKDVRFTPAEIESIAVTEKRWNFRRKKTKPPQGSA